MSNYYTEEIYAIAPESAEKLGNLAAEVDVTDKSSVEAFEAALCEATNHTPGVSFWGMCNDCREVDPEDPLMFALTLYALHFECKAKRPSYDRKGNLIK